MSEEKSQTQRVKTTTPPIIRGWAGEERGQRGWGEVLSCSPSLKLHVHSQRNEHLQPQHERFQQQLSDRLKVYL